MQVSSAEIDTGQGKDSIQYNTLSIYERRFENPAVSTRLFPKGLVCTYSDCRDAGRKTKGKYLDHTMF